MKNYRKLKWQKNLFFSFNEEKNNRVYRKWLQNFFLMRKNRDLKLKSLFFEVKKGSITKKEDNNQKRNCLSRRVALTDRQIDRKRKRETERDKDFFMQDRKFF